MNRRRFVLAAGVSLASGLSGCTDDTDGGGGGNGGGSGDSGDSGGDISSDGGSDNQTTPSVEKISVSAEDYSQERAYNSLKFRYATKTVAKLRSPDGAAREPDSGNKYLVLHGEITFESESNEQVDVYGGSATGLSADQVVYSGVTILNLPGLKRTVTSGATFDGWTAYQAFVFS